MRSFRVFVVVVGILLLALPAKAQDENWATETYTGVDPQITFKVRAPAPIVVRGLDDDIAEKARRLLPMLNMVTVHAQPAGSQTASGAAGDMPAVTVSAASPGAAAASGTDYLFLHELAIGTYRLFVLAPKQAMHDPATFVPLYSQVSEDGTYAEVADTPPERQQLEHLFAALQDGRLSLD